jgi:hypothetical protein
MATGVIGAAVSLWTLPESTYGTAPSGNYHQLGFMSAALGPQQDQIEVPVLGLGTGRNPTDPMLGEINVNETITVPVNQVGFGHWLRLMMGAPSSTGSSPDFTHVFTSGAAALPSNTLVLDYGARLGTNRYGKITGARAASMAVQFSNAGPADAQISLIAQGGEYASSAGAGTPAVAAGPVFNRATGVVRIGSDAVLRVTSAELTMDNGMIPLRTIRADRKIEEAEEGLFTATGSVTVRFAEGGLLPGALAGTPVNLSLALELSAARSLVFNMPRCYLNQPRAQIEGPGGVSATFGFRASGEGVAGAVVATLKNAQAGAAYE